MFVIFLRYRPYLYNILQLPSNSVYRASCAWG